MKQIDTSVNLGPLQLKNPVTVASGTYGYGTAYDRYYPSSTVGGIFLKGITSSPRDGNPTPRICETPSGMINSIGLQNIGIDHLEQESVQLQQLDTTVFANISGADEGDFARLAFRASRIAGISALELNVSCPNLKGGGIDFGRDPKMIATITNACVKESLLPVFVKLTPNVTDIVTVAAAAMNAGATGVSLVNTFQAMAIDIEKRIPKLKNVMGGLSGPAIRPIAVRMVWQVWRDLKCPIIGMGGIASSEDAIEFLMAGASAVSIGTMNFVKPMIVPEVINGICKWCEHHDVAAVAELIGAANK